MYSAIKTEILRYLGYSGQKISPEITSLIDETIKEVSMFTPLHTYAVSDVVFEENAVFLRDIDIVLQGTDIQNHLKGAVKCITFACTLGAVFDAELMRKQPQSMTKALIFDSAGTAFIEAAADRTESDILKPYHDAGLFSKFRYSPGYGDLPITLQQDITKALDCPRKIGLTVTENNILIPRKSITAFIGIFDTPQEKPRSKCVACQMRDSCKMRKDGFSCD